MTSIDPMGASWSAALGQQNKDGRVMTKLLNSHRQAITTHLLDATFRERELRLKQQEHALGLRLLRALYGDDALRRMAEVPDGWMPISTQVHFRYNEETYHHINYVTLTDPVRIPASHASPIAPPYWLELWDAHRDARSTLRGERRQLEIQVHGTLAAFTMVEKLAEGWPEGYAHFPHQDLATVGQLPALRIEDLNARLAAAREAA